jgi:Fe-S cluster biogenesis protein NfuA
MAEAALMPIQPEFQERLQSIEQLIAKIDTAADPNLRSNVRELVQLVMDLHGAGLERMLELTGAAGEAGDSIIQKLGRDELVASLLVLYGLHPLDVDARVIQALDKLQPRLRAHDGEVHLLSVQDGVVRLRLEANGHGCGSTGQALKEIVEGALYQAAPDIASLIIEGAEEKAGFVPIEMLQGSLNGLAFTAGKK